MANAQEDVRIRYPNARVVHGVFGKIVETDETGDKALGSGREYWDEEAWISAVEEMEEEEMME